MADSVSAVAVGTAFLSSALLVAGIYAVNPEYLPYAVALSGIITSVAFLTSGSSMSHHASPNPN